MPGRIDTDRVRFLDSIAAENKDISNEEWKKLMESSIPMGRYGTIEEFGKVGTFLLSDAASYTTGATIAVDGGMMKTVW